MKRSRLFLWILGIIMQAFLVSIHFYQKNVEAMRTESEDLLVEVLEKELHRKQQELNLFYVSRVVVDTVPLIIRVTTSEGVKSYTVDAKKSKMNISQNMAERSWHSVVCTKVAYLQTLYNNFGIKYSKDIKSWLKPMYTYQ